MDFVCPPLSFGKRSLAPDDLFFDLGNQERELFWKKISLPNDQGGLSSLLNVEDEDAIVCSVDGCKSCFRSTWEFEAHYSTAHINICSVCRRTFPSSRLLDIHLDEAHSTYFATIASKAGSEPLFRCLVEGCARLFKGDFQRHRHLLDFHRWPANLTFPFHPTKHRPQKQRRRKFGALLGVGSLYEENIGGDHTSRISAPYHPKNAIINQDEMLSMNSTQSLGPEQAMLITRRGGGSKSSGSKQHSKIQRPTCNVKRLGAGSSGEKDDTMDLDGLCNDLQSLAMVPRAVRFGRGGGGGGSIRRHRQKPPANPSEGASLLACSSRT
jgi:hypothetical protein